MFSFTQLCRDSLLKQSRQLIKKPQRYFDLHEFQSKEVMRSFGINVQKGALAYNGDEAAKVCEGLSNKGGLILKAQVHAGGRGKGKLTSGLQGGVKICKTPEEIKNFTDQMIGYNLITHQTTAKGLPVNSVLVHEGVDIDRQIYLAFLLDRESGGPVVVASKKGGMDIEAVAEEDPEAILKFYINFKEGMTEAQAQEIVDKLDLESGAQKAQGVKQLQRLYELFIKLDSTQVEINPWAVTPEGDLYCVDAKINIDDNALFRHQDLVAMKAETAASEDVDENEAKAEQLGLNYIGLDGNIGCMVNGAGLAMATMDIIKLKGENPANFLDIGGGANAEQVSAAFKILNDHPSVEAILINIFGGIVKCDLIAQEVIKATQRVKIDVPIVMRLTGTNSDEANRLMAEYNDKGEGIKIEMAQNLDEAASKIVKSISRV